MSYILDALKKSEEERRKLEEEQRSPYSSATGSKVPSSRKRIGPSILISAFMLLTILIMVTGWWYIDRSPIEKAVMSTQPEGESIPVETAILNSSDQEPAVAEPSVEKNQSVSPPDTGVSDESPAEMAARGPENPFEKIPLLSELPFSTRSMLPEMQFRGHVYSPTPDKRMIMINATIIREGDLVGPELTLSEITDTGLIMKYRDTVFQVNLF